MDEEKNHEIFMHELSIFYKRFNPDRLPFVNEIAAKYKGRGAELLSYLRHKYKAPYDTTHLVASKKNKEVVIENENTLAAKLQKFYSQAAPTRINTISTLLNQYKGREDELIEYLEAKYHGHKVSWNNCNETIASYSHESNLNVEEEEIEEEKEKSNPKRVNNEDSDDSENIDIKGSNFKVNLRNRVVQVIDKRESEYDKKEDDEKVEKVEKEVIIRENENKGEEKHISNKSKHLMLEDSSSEEESLKKVVKVRSDSSKEKSRAMRYFVPEGISFKCFSCGEKGHHQSNCPNGGFPPCFQCTQSGHRTSECPLALCSLCFLPGHIAKLCKNSINDCEKCLKRGHSSSDCYLYNLSSKDEKDNEDLKQIQCLVCLKRGHSFCSDKPKFFINSQSVMVGCFNCGSTLHEGSMCKLAKADELLKNFHHPEYINQKRLCFICQSANHIASECPNDSKRQQKQQVKCFSCNEFGHFKSECPYHLPGEHINNNNGYAVNKNNHQTYYSHRHVGSVKNNFNKDRSGGSKRNSNHFQTPSNQHVNKKRKLNHTN